MENAVDITIIYNWVKGSWLQQDSSQQIHELSIDTRTIISPEQTLFIALKTSKRDGHKFIDTAYSLGVRNFLISTPIEINKFTEANFILVDNTHLALQNIGSKNRQQYNIPIVGITGSNGKTIVKEWLYHLLSEQYRTVRSPKSYNSQIGVPLSLWSLNNTVELGIFEAGISTVNEMKIVERLIKPTIGIFTNIGDAHSAGFDSLQQKVDEKLDLFKDCNTVIYCLDHELIDNRIKDKKSEHSTQLITWSKKENSNASVIIQDIVKTKFSTSIHFKYNNFLDQITIPFSDTPSIENAIHCLCTLIALDIFNVVRSRFSTLPSVSMRLEIIEGTNNCTIINDAYNSDLTSLLPAIDFLTQQSQHQNHTLVLSDMQDVNSDDNNVYQKVANLLTRKQIYRLIGIGKDIYANRNLFKQIEGLKTDFYKSTEELLNNVAPDSFSNEAILLKGARIYKFEKISATLEQKKHQTELELDFHALSNNLSTIKNKLATDVKTMAMVKAFSYGSGSYEIASRLEHLGIDYLAVAYIDEGISLRKAGISTPILVLNPEPFSYGRMITWNLEPEIFNISTLVNFTATTEAANIDNYPIHIKLETGMHRLGFISKDIEHLIEILSKTSSIKVASIFSHLASSDIPQQDSFTKMQVEEFNQLTQKILNHLDYRPLLHISNTAAIIRHPDLQYDMVRLGLGLYGIDTSNILGTELQPVSQLTATITQIKEVNADQSVGYGYSPVNKDTKIAIVSIGYADGYPRVLGNGNAYMLINGHKAYTIGSICMDMCMIDITNIRDVNEGDKVIVFNKELPVTLLAEWAHTIPYEILTNISQRVKRVYINEV